MNEGRQQTKAPTERFKQRHIQMRCILITMANLKTCPAIVFCVLRMSFVSHLTGGGGVGLQVCPAKSISTLVFHTSLFTTLVSLWPAMFLQTFSFSLHNRPIPVQRMVLQLFLTPLHIDSVRILSVNISTKRWQVHLGSYVRVQ